MKQIIVETVATWNISEDVASALETGRKVPLHRYLSEGDEIDTVQFTITPEGKARNGWHAGMRIVDDVNTVRVLLNSSNRYFKGVKCLGVGEFTAVYYDGTQVIIYSREPVGRK